MTFNLEGLLLPAMPAIVAALQEHRYIELTRTALVIHVRPGASLWTGGVGHR